MATQIFHVPSYRLYLSQVLGERCARNPRYSLRAFARDLDTSPGFLSLLFRHKHSLSLDKSRVIAARLKLPLHEQDYFVAMVRREQTDDESEMQVLRQKHAFLNLRTDLDLAPDLSLRDFALYLKISLLGFVAPSDSMRHFQLDEEVFLSFCHRLVNLGWLEPKRDGFSALKAYARTESFDPSETRRIFHQKIMQLGLEQLDGVDMKERYFYSFVFSLKREEYEELCSTIAQFCLSKCDRYGSRDSHDRIYALGVQVLPIAEIERSNSPSL